MAFDPTNLKVYLPNGKPTTNTGASGGDLNFSDPADGSLGDIIAQLPVPALGNPVLSYYYAEGVRNEDPADWLTPGFWWKNLLLRPSGAGPFSIVPTSPLQTGKALLIYRQAGEFVSEFVALNGATPAPSGGAADEDSDVGMIVCTSGGAQTAAPAPIFVVRGDSLGMVHTGGSCAFSWGRLGLDPSVNNSLAATNRRTAPVGVDFAQAQDYDSRLLIPGPSSMVENDWVKWWYEISPPDGWLTPSGYYWEPAVGGRGDDGT